MRRAVLVLLGVAVVVAVSGCAAGGNDAVVPRPDGAGFWLGVWHGMIAPITFVISLFDDRVGMYAVHNSGHLYDLGFLLGLSVGCSSVTGSGQAGTRRRRRRDR